jgi:hypothetical protein
MQGMISVRRAALALLAAMFVVAGCAASVTDGTGSAVSAGAPASSHSPDFPSPTAPSSASTDPSSAGTQPSRGTRSSGTSQSSSGSATPSAAQRQQALAALAAGDDVAALVAVPGGYEAASFDQQGGIRFWFDPQSSVTWRRIGASSYPYSPQVGAPEARANGALLRNMQHATFIVTGNFTGDASGNAVAFTTGPRGWGTIKAEPNGNIGPSGAPVGSNRIGLSYGFAFADGYLITADCPQDRPIADCDTHQIRKRWVWAGHDFHRA